MYLSATAIAAMAGENKVHFLNPQAVRLDKSLGDAVGLQHIGVHLIRGAPGRRSTEYHSHRFEEECIYVLSGHGSATIGGDTIGPGDFIGCPINGVAHEMINDGDEPLLCLVMGQRLSHDEADYPRQGKRLYRGSGRAELVDHSAIEQAKR